MRRLEELLSDISPGEREEALKYYNDYINDGGKDNEEDVLKSLGTPEQVAAIIKDGLDGNTGEFTESGFKSSASQNDNQVGKYNGPKSYGPGSYKQNSNASSKSSMSGGMIALIVILCILGSPLILGLGGGLLGGFFGIVAGLFGIFLAFAIIAVVFLIVGVSMVPIGIVYAFASPLGGMAAIAAGLVLTGLGLLFLLLTVLIIGKVIPAMFKGIVSLCERIFGGKGGKN
jgi:uncharacterized membrane protein